MGKVVDIESAAEPKGARRGRVRKRPSKTALVLGGGGFTGGVYEIGALRALDLLATNSTVNEFDVYVGTSAGSFVSSLVANGVTPEEMMRVLNRDLPSPIRDIDLSTLLSPNYTGFVRGSLVFPFKLVSVLRETLGQLGEISAVDVVMGLAAALPERRLLGSRDRALRRGGALRPRPHQRLPAARPRALPDRHRPRHDRARDPRRGRVVGGADLDRGRRLGGAARHLRAGRDRRPRVHRRRHPVDHQRRRRDRARREVRRRDQPARPLRQRLPEEHPDGHRVAGPARLRHGDRRRSSTRPSGCSPTIASTARSRSGRSATRASTSS